MTTWLAMESVQGACDSGEGCGDDAQVRLHGVQPIVVSAIWPPVVADVVSVCGGVAFRVCRPPLAECPYTAAPTIEFIDPIDDD